MVLAVAVARAALCRGPSADASQRLRCAGWRQPASADAARRVRSLVCKLPNSLPFPCPDPSCASPALCAVVQRFLERGGPEVRAAVAEAVRGKALPLSLQVSYKQGWLGGAENRVGWAWSSRLMIGWVGCQLASDPVNLSSAPVPLRQVYGCRVVQKALEVGWLGPGWAVDWLGRAEAGRV